VLDVQVVEPGQSRQDVVFVRTLSYDEQPSHDPFPWGDPGRPSLPA